MDIVHCTCALLDMYCNHDVMLNSSMPSLLHCTSQHCASGFDRVAAVQRSRQQPDVKEDMTLLKTPELKFAAKSKFTTLMNINKDGMTLTVKHYLTLSVPKLYSQVKSKK